MDFKKQFIPNDSEEFKRIKKLFQNLNEKLDQEDKKRNTMTISEFSRYETLYQNHDLQNMSNADISELRSLADEFYRTVNPIKPIRIMDDEKNKCIIELPPIFINTEKISTDNNNIRYIDTLKNDPNASVRDIAEYSVDFFNRQLTDENKKRIRETRLLYKTAVDKLNKKSDDLDEQDYIEEDTKSVDEIDGIIWD